MYRRLIAKYIGYPLQDFIKKTNIIDTKKILLESQYWDDNKIYEYRLRKLRKLIEYSYVHVPYYQKLFDKVGIKPKDIKEIDDLVKIPILTKEIVYKEHTALISQKSNNKNIKIGKTGGTTGAPIPVYKDVLDRSFAWASYYRWYEWMGLELGEKVATFWGAPAVLKDSIRTKIRQNTIDFVQNSITINSFAVNGKTIRNIYKRIEKFNPILLKGYVSALIDFVGFLNDNNIEQKLNLKALSTTSEELPPVYRNFLEKEFKSKIFDQYGCGEVSAISYECSAHNGLHINQEHVLLEILDENNSNVIDKKGRIIVTGLDNYVMPFIRYENGDMSSILSKKCNCGVNQSLMGAIDGRISNSVTLKDGSNVHGVFFTDILYELGIYVDKIPRFQIYQMNPGEIIFKLEVKGVLDSAAINRIRENTMKFFNNVEIEIHDHLPSEKNGKFLYIKNN